MRRRVLDGLLSSHRSWRRRSSLGPECIGWLWKEAVPTAKTAATAADPELRRNNRLGGGLTSIWARQDRAIYNEAGGTDGMEDPPAVQIPKGIASVKGCAGMQCMYVCMFLCLSVRIRSEIVGIRMEAIPILLF